MEVQEVPVATVGGLGGAAGPAGEVDPALRQQVVTSMTALLVRMLRLDRPVTEATTLMDELGLSSSRAMELLLEVEDDLSIAIDIDELDQERMYSLGELADYIATHSTAM